MAASLIIGGIDMPELKHNGLTIKKEKVWSKNTGRTADATMVGDVVATKYTLEVEWPPLTNAQADVVDKAITPAFFSVNFRDLDGSRKTIRMYAGTPTYPVYSYASGLPRYVGTAVTLIEK